MQPPAQRRAAERLHDGLLRGIQRAALELAPLAHQVFEDLRRARLRLRECLQSFAELLPAAFRLNTNEASA